VNINWQEAPKWAKAAAQDEDGRWYYYDKVPRPGFSGWLFKGRKSRFIKLTEPNVKWREALILRPIEENK